jgi:hypothetical protein
MKLIVTGLTLLFSLNALSGLSEDFDKLKNSGHNLEPTGAICEDVAQLRFAEKYPEPQYKVVTGIEYSDRDGTLGELDLIVFNNQTQVAEVVAEVKCWKNAKSGLKKAKTQIARFVKNVKSTKALKFKWLSQPQLSLTKTQFNKVSSYLYIAQANTLNDGYDYELPYTLQELMQLRGDLINCQASGNCAKPE